MVTRAASVASWRWRSLKESLGLLGIGAVVGGVIMGIVNAAGPEAWGTQLVTTILVGLGAILTMVVALGWCAFGYFGTSRWVIESRHRLRRRRTRLGQLFISIVLAVVLSPVVFLVAGAEPAAVIGLLPAAIVLAVAGVCIVLVPSGWDQTHADR